MALRFSTLFGPQSRLVVHRGVAGQQVLPHLPTGAFLETASLFASGGVSAVFPEMCRRANPPALNSRAGLHPGDFAPLPAAGRGLVDAPQAAESGIVHRIHAAADMMNIFFCLTVENWKTAGFSGHYFLAPAVRAGGPSGETGVKEG